MSLIELLVVISIVGVLVGLCLPAVQTNCRHLRRPAPTAVVATGTAEDDDPSIEPEAPEAP